MMIKIKVNEYISIPKILILESLKLLHKEDEFNEADKIISLMEAVKGYIKRKFLILYKKKKWKLKHIFKKQLMILQYILNLLQK